SVPVLHTITHVSLKSRFNGTEVLQWSHFHMTTQTRTAHAGNAVLGALRGSSFRLIYLFGDTDDLVRERVERYGRRLAEMPTGEKRTRINFFVTNCPARGVNFFVIYVSSRVSGQNPKNSYTSQNKCSLQRMQNWRKNKTEKQKTARSGKSFS
ncbi:unnamed protein product, partial [Scytosiphon promiscuus]